MLSCIHGKNVIKITLTDSVRRFLERYTTLFPSCLILDMLQSIALSSFKTYVWDFESSHVDGENLDFFAGKVLNWLENYWRPATMRDSILRDLEYFGPKMVDQHVRDRLAKWCAFQNSYYLGQFAIINRFKIVANRVLKILRLDGDSKI